LPSFNWRATGKSTAHKPRRCNLKSQTTRPWASSKSKPTLPPVCGLLVRLIEQYEYYKKGTAARVDTS
jgi:hypothetical protein